MASTLPQFNVEIEQYDVEADSVGVQEGKFKRPTFFDDISTSQAHEIFTKGVNAALMYSGYRHTKDDLVEERTEQYRLTRAEMDLLKHRARSVSRYSKIPYDTVEDFLVITCYVDDIRDMKLIADCVQIPELYEQNMVRKPMQILNVRGLENISFAAQALDGLINMFRKYIGISQNMPNSSKGDDVGGMLNAISGMVGGLGTGVELRLETAEIGNFLSELITGAPIPTNVIAKNPMLQSPSYIGKAFFGEAKNPLSNTDINQLFPKVIAVFPQASSGAGTSSFSMQNFGSFSREMTLNDFVSKVVMGTVDVGTQRKINQVKSIVDKVNNLTGSKATDIIDVTRSDNALPIMAALSTVLSGTDKSVFSKSSFQNGWVNAQSVASIMSRSNPNFMEAARRFL